MNKKTAEQIDREHYAKRPVKLQNGINIYTDYNEPLLGRKNVD